MAMFITDPLTIDQVKAQRAETGADKHDEVWDGVYVVSPLANNEQQEIAFRLGAVFLSVLDENPKGRAIRTTLDDLTGLLPSPSRIGIRLDR